MFLCVMHIDTIPNRGSKPTYLLRESVRDGDRVRKVKLANLSSLPIEQIEMIRRVLKGETLGPVEDGLDCVRSVDHGHADAVRTAMSSRPGDFHPEALPEPCMTLSSHTAPDVRPLPWHSGQ